MGRKRSVYVWRLVGGDFAFLMSHIDSHQWDCGLVGLMI